MSKDEVVEIGLNSIGQSVPRKEDATLLTGRGQYIADIRLPEMLHASFVRSPFAHAKIISIDDSAAREIAGVKFTSRKLDGIPPKELKPLVDSLKSQLGSGIVAVVAVNDGTASLVVGVTDDLVGRISAVDLVRAGSAAVGGKGGGGRPDMAQAGGPNGDAADAAIDAIVAAIAEML